MKHTARGKSKVGFRKLTNFIHRSENHMKLYLHFLSEILGACKLLSLNKLMLN